MADLGDVGNGDRLARDKAALRERMRSLRDAIPAHERTRRSEAVTARVLGLPAVEGDGAVLLFNSFRSEVATGGLIASFDDRGRTVLLPVVAGDRLVPAPYRPGDPLVRSPFGVDEPASPGSADPATIELVIAPGLAFDRDGFRLGYGRGYYDRLLAELSDGATRIGIGFHEQLLERLPRGPRDQRLHLVVTDLEVVVAGTG